MDASTSTSRDKLDAARWRCEMARVNVRTSSRGDAAKTLQKFIKELDAEDVLVGVPRGAKEDNGMSIALIASVHEFGSPKRNIPERSFLRAGIRASTEDISKIAARQLKLIAKDQQTPSNAIQMLGLAGQAAVQKYIRHGDFEPLSPRTIEAKGSDKPLIDTGNMLQSITYEVRKK